VAETKVWRCSPRALFWARLGFPTLSLAGGALVLAGLLGATEPHVGVGVGAILLISGLALQRFTLYPSLEATRSGLVVRNPISTKTVAWDDIKRISPGYGGLQIEVDGESLVTVWYVQKNNWDIARGNRTRADEVTDELAVRFEGDARAGRAVQRVHGTGSLHAEVRPPSHARRERRAGPLPDPSDRKGLFLSGVLGTVTRMPEATYRVGRRASREVDDHLRGFVRGPRAPMGGSLGRVFPSGR
jgi:hypothetical protein